MNLWEGSGNWSSEMFREIGSASYWIQWVEEKLVGREIWQNQGDY